MSQLALQGENPSLSFRSLLFLDFIASLWSVSERLLAVIMWLPVWLSDIPSLIQPIDVFKWRYIKFGIITWPKLQPIKACNHSRTFRLDLHSKPFQRHQQNCNLSVYLKDLKALFCGQPCGIRTNMKGKVPFIKKQQPYYWRTHTHATGRTRRPALILIFWPTSAELESHKHWLKIHSTSSCFREGLLCCISGL